MSIDVNRPWIVQVAHEGGGKTLHGIFFDKAFADSLATRLRDLGLDATAEPWAVSDPLPSVSVGGGMVYGQIDHILAVQRYILSSNG